MRFGKRGFCLIAATLIASSFSTPSQAEVSEVHVARQYGLSYLPLMVMQDRKLVEKYAKREGLGDIKVSYLTLGGGGPINDGIISGRLDFGSGAVGAMATVWAKTKGNLDVKAVAALNSMPVFLNTRDANIKSIKDFTDKDKIALPAVKISTQATTLQMACAQLFGQSNWAKLDSITVNRSHPDGMVALLSGAGEIDAHFTAPPFQYQELKHPGIHTVLNSYDVLGGPATFNVVWATSKFRDANPKTYAAFVKALDEAIAIINQDKRAAAEFYLKASNDKDSVEDVYAMFTNPDIKFTTTPERVFKVVDFMYTTGSVKVKPSSWKDLFFPNIWNAPGS